MTIVIRVRRETADDIDTIRRIHELAFATKTGDPAWEAQLVDELRAGHGWMPALSIVAEVDGQVAGHVVATRGRLEHGDGTITPALGIGPVGVAPDHQRLGIGTRLVYALLGAAQAVDEEVACLLGNPAYYCRFGFVRSSELGIAPPDPRWVAHFQALPLGAGRWTATPSTFHYDPAFDLPA